MLLDKLLSFSWFVSLKSVRDLKKLLSALSLSCPRCQQICWHCVNQYAATVSAKPMTISSQFNIVVDYVTLHFLTVWNNIFFYFYHQFFFNKKNNLLGIQRSLWLLGHYVHIVNEYSDMILCTAYNYNADTHFSQISLQKQEMLSKRLYLFIRGWADRVFLW